MKCLICSEEVFIMDGYLCKDHFDDYIKGKCSPYEGCTDGSYEACIEFNKNKRRETDEK